MHFGLLTCDEGVDRSKWERRDKLLIKKDTGVDMPLDKNKFKYL